MRLQNEMLMGWGALSPEPSPGVYDFGVLDQRLALIRSTGGTPVMTLCGAPDWMKGGTAGRTNWSNLATPPLPQYYEAFAELAVTVAKRYPQIRYFQVWNELKGFWDTKQNRWNYEAYTTFYNTVYDALKHYDPALKVGGPYVVFDSYKGTQSNPSSIHGSWGTLDQRPLDVVNYWLAHKHGADFVAVDATTAPNYAGGTANLFQAIGKLAAVDKWLKTKTSLPIWWSEVYPVPLGSPVSSNVAASLTADAVLTLAASGASVVLLWQEPFGSACIGSCLWTDTRNGNGGRSTPTGSAVLELASLLQPAAVIRSVTGLPSGIVGYSVGEKVVLVNTLGTARTVVTAATDTTVPADGIAIPGSRSH